MGADQNPLPIRRCSQTKHPGVQIQQCASRQWRVAFERPQPDRAIVRGRGEPTPIRSKYQAIDILIVFSKDHWKSLRERPKGESDAVTRGQPAASRVDGNTDQLPDVTPTEDDRFGIMWRIDRPGTELEVISATRQLSADGFPRRIAKLGGPRLNRRRNCGEFPDRAQTQTTRFSSSVEAASKSDPSAENLNNGLFTGP